MRRRHDAPRYGVPGEGVHAGGFDFPVAEEDVELPHRLLRHGAGRQQRFIQPALVKVWQEPVLQGDGAAARADLALRHAAYVDHQ